MALLLLLACGAPTWGTWMFTKAVTVATGDECETSVTHNLAGATLPEEIAGDTGWVETSAAEVTPEVFFARVEEAGDGAVLITGEDAWPGARQDNGSWVFRWETGSTGQDDASHASGYAWHHVYASAAEVRITGDFAGDGFTGLHETESTTDGSWTESDTWSEEAAAYVGDNGEIPVGEHLVVVDGTTGTATAANNAREASECGDSGDCALTVHEGCLYSYTLTGKATEFSPDDAPWTSDAGQAAGQ